MKTSGIKKEFLKRIKATGHSLDSLPLSQGIESMLRFYQDQRIDGCDMEEDGDMLLFQWGCNDWGEGEFFEVEIARQSMNQEGDDDSIRQLRLTYKFEPDATLRKIKDGNKWCESLDDVEAFRKFIHASKAFQAATKLTATEIALEFAAAG